MGGCVGRGRNSARNWVTWISQRPSATSTSDINLELAQRISSSLHRDSAHAILLRVRGGWLGITPTLNGPRFGPTRRHDDDRIGSVTGHVPSRPRDSLRFLSRPPRCFVFGDRSGSSFVVSYCVRHSLSLCILPILGSDLRRARWLLC